MVLKGGGYELNFQAVDKVEGIVLLSSNDNQCCPTCYYDTQIKILHIVIFIAIKLMDYIS